MLQHIYIIEPALLRNVGATPKFHMFVASAAHHKAAAPVLCHFQLHIVISGPLLIVFAAFLMVHVLILELNDGGE
jgi:hypothetical protein